MKISDLVKQIKLKQQNVTEGQIIDCVNAPDLPKGVAFDSEIFAKQVGHKILIVACKAGSVIDVIFTDLVNKLSFYNDAGELYCIAFSATGKKSFYDSSPDHEVWGKID